MQVIKEFQKIKSNEVRINVPDDFVDNDVEITVKKITGPQKKQGLKRKLLLNAIRLDTRGFKFSRDEANER